MTATGRLARPAWPGLGRGGHCHCYFLDSHWCPNCRAEPFKLPAAATQPLRVANEVLIPSTIPACHCRAYGLGGGQTRLETANVRTRSNDWEGRPVVSDAVRCPQ